MENFNRTMQNLNATAERVNALLNEFEEPARTVLPKITRTVNLADDVAAKVAGPIDQIVPGLTRLAETLNSPALTSLPTDLTRFVDTMNDLVRKLAPLVQLAESAGGLFGLRLLGSSRPTPPATPPVEVVAVAPDVPRQKHKAPAKKAAAKRKATAKRKAPAKPKAAAKRKAVTKKSSSR
jgi:hypothetical protein